jgi:HSP20 family protein
MCSTLSGTVEAKEGVAMTALLEKPALKPRKLSLFDQLRDEMDRMFEGAPLVRPGFMPWRAELTFVPPLEIVEKDNALLVKADLPGMKKEDVKVEVAPEGLTIMGERKEEKEEKKEGYYRTERLYGTFERFVPLPDGAVLDKAVANFKDGVLEVKVPLGAARKPEAKTLLIG